jgi:hypothetical protein
MTTLAPQPPPAPQPLEPYAVRLEAPERMCLLGLLLRGVLASSLEDPRRAARARRLRGELEVQAGQMVVTLRFGGDGVVLASGASGSPRARVRGSMRALVEVASGARLVGPILTREVRVGGSLVMLIRVMPLIRATGRPARSDAPGTGSPA